MKPSRTVLPALQDLNRFFYVLFHGFVQEPVKDYGIEFAVHEPAEQTSLPCGNVSPSQVLVRLLIRQRLMQSCVSFLESDKIGGKPRSEAENVNLGRARIYDFLSRAFKKEIDEHFVEVIASTSTTLEELSESQNSEEMKEGSDLLLDFTDTLSLLNSEGRKWLISNLAAEYTQLFMKAGPYRVDLVESVYLGKNHAPYQEPYFEVARAYSMLGFEKEKDFTEPEDHVAIELEFMTNLCKWTARTLESGNVQDATKYLNLQKEFLREHILKWVPDLCLKLRDAATSSFYRSLAYLTSGFIALDERMPSQIAETLSTS